MRDLRYALRGLMKKPAFTATAVITLALGIGANSAIFTVVDGVLLKSLPYDQPERLVRLWGTNAVRGQVHTNVSPQDFLDWEAQSVSFDGLAAYTVGDVTLTGPANPMSLASGFVTHRYFAVLGVTLPLGRAFSPDEDRPGGAPVVILSDEVWRNVFSADPAVIGRAISLDGMPHTVIGVAPRNFAPPAYSRRAVSPQDIWLPVQIGPENDRGGHWLTAIARMRQDVTLAEAQAEMDAISEQLGRQYPESNSGRGVRLEPLHEATVGNVRPALVVLFGAVGFVLLIACANLTNLLLINTAGRQRELALRATLGASRGKIIRELLVESLALSVSGGLVGVLLAIWITDALVALAGASIPHVDQISVDLRVLAFTASVSFLTGIAIGIIPARRVSRPDLAAALKIGGRGSVSSSTRPAIRNSLVASQLALALVLLIGAGLMIKSFRTLLQVDPGFNPRSLLTLKLSLPREAYPERSQVVAFYEQLFERLEGLPGVNETGAVTMLPMGGSYSCDGFEIEGRAWPQGADECAEFRVAAGDYFRAMGITLQRGRLFDINDRAEAPSVAVINEAMAQRYWPGEDPLGERILYGAPWTIVGVVADVKHFGLDSDAAAEVYLNHPQYPFSRDLAVVISASEDPTSVTERAREQVWALDPNLPVRAAATMGQLINRSVAPRRFRMLVLGVFAALAALLAVLGVYGVIAYGVSQRTHEIGVRMALGARSHDVLTQILREGLRLMLVGIVIGAAAALALTRILTSLLFQVSPSDPLVFAAVAALLVAMGLLATYVPGRKATRVDPLEALRYE